MVYFAIYPIHPKNLKGTNKGEFTKEQENLKIYLDNKGTKLTTIAELLPFYALPYIKSPQVNFLIKKNLS